MNTTPLPNVLDIVDDAHARLAKARGIIELMRCADLGNLGGDAIEDAGQAIIDLLNDVGERVSELRMHAS